MSIIYVYTFDSPSGVGPLPPTVASNPQGEKLFSAITQRVIKVPLGVEKTILFFDTVEELTSWIEEHRITDPGLLADIELWNNAHNIVHHHNYYSTAELDIAITPVF
jgi:hypothetical protein